MRDARATLFTEDAMTKPLFQEPTPDIEREDPFSGPKGFMFGCMSQASMASLAEEYFDAGDLILEAIKRGDMEDYKLANAALFLFRHGAELILKAGLGQFDRTHNLSSLADAFAAFVKQDHKEGVPQWIIDRLKELAAIDPGSLAFRYGEYRDPLDNGRPSLDGEVYVDLRQLQAAMKALKAALVPAVKGISDRRGWRR
jgi:hypothetical protein